MLNAKPITTYKVESCSTLTQPEIIGFVAMDILEGKCLELNLEYLNAVYSDFHTIRVIEKTDLVITSDENNIQIVFAPYNDGIEITYRKNDIFIYRSTYDLDDLYNLDVINLDDEDEDD